jgi:hypothetical protein
MLCSWQSAHDSELSTGYHNMGTASDRIIFASLLAPGATFTLAVYKESLLFACGAGQSQLEISRYQWVKSEIPAGRCHLSPHRSSSFALTPLLSSKILFYILQSRSYKRLK